MHPGACLFAEDPGRQLRARQAAARHDNPVHAAEAVASRRQSIAACKAHITMALNRDDIAKANKMVRQLGILHPDAKQEIEEQAKRVSRASGDQQQGLQAARELYVDMMTMEESKDRPFDRCGAFGCLLLDKQLRPRIRTPFCLSPALILVLTTCLACAARACTSSKKSRAANDHGARQLRWSPQILSKSSHMQRPNPLCAAAGEGAGAGGRLRPLPPRQEAEAGGGAAAPRPRPRRAMPKSSTWLPSRPCAGELLGGLGSFW